MKLFFYILLSLTAVTGQSALAADTFSSTSNSKPAGTNVILHLNDKAKLPMLEKNVSNLRKELGDDVNIRVIINGRAITAMLSDNKLVEEKIKSMLENKAVIGLCHTSMRNNNIDKKHLIEGVTILPEGAIITIIKLQKEGYVYIKI